MLERVCYRQECLKPFNVKKPSDPKKYCSRSCSATINNRVSPKRKPEGSCKTCGVSVSTSRYYCTAHIRGPRTSYVTIGGVRVSRDDAVSMWKSGEWAGGSERSLHGVIRKYILEKYNFSCTVCGFDDLHPVDGGFIVEVDHINGTGSDHRESNLTLLCPNHHAMTPTYRGRNRGNGRKVYYTRTYK